MSDPKSGVSIEPGRWPLGADDVSGMIERGELELVQASPDHAGLLISQAEGHLQAAAPLTEVHPSSAYNLLYDAARLALTAALAKQGLRPTRAGGHLAVQEAVEAQLGPNVRHVIRAFRMLRRRRNDNEYPSLDTLPITAEEAEDSLQDARDIVDIMRKLLPRLGPW
ncbi:HEPN domain-containing protein [Nocardioides speluncae]|uniref:HEPN domain-containing protein n=1 Tax=Nocardioides speluncae TaxID=2670337 RepID=UPI000D69FADB|nr:HEPN domain-containing protein [Nocardioides speluncae]